MIPEEQRAKGLLQEAHLKLVEARHCLIRADLIEIDDEASVTERHLINVKNKLDKVLPTPVDYLFD